MTENSEKKISPILIILVIIVFGYIGFKHYHENYGNKDESTFQAIGNLFGNEKEKSNNESETEFKDSHIKVKDWANQSSVEEAMQGTWYASAYAGQNPSDVTNWEREFIISGNNVRIRLKTGNGNWTDNGSFNFNLDKTSTHGLSEDRVISGGVTYYKFRYDSSDGFGILEARNDYNGMFRWNGYNLERK